MLRESSCRIFNQKKRLRRNTISIAKGDIFEIQKQGQRAIKLVGYERDCKKRGVIQPAYMRLQEKEYRKIDVADEGRFTESFREEGLPV